jgi:hypothetical protein
MRESRRWVFFAMRHAHLYRLFEPFRFEVFDHTSPPAASFRGAIILIRFGALSF